MLNKLFTCQYHQSYRYLSFNQVSFVYTFQFLRERNVLTKGVYGCFTLTTLLTTMFTMILLVYILCIPSFVLTGYCFSELHANSVPIVMYGLRLFIVVLQEL